jgi:hypothetical protein
MVFGPLGLLRPGAMIDIEGLRVQLPRLADLAVEKLVTDRTGEKGARDLLVVAGLLAVSGPEEVEAIARLSLDLSAESRHSIRSALTVLSLMEPHAGMPDPGPVRDRVRQVLSAIEARDV